MFSRKAILWFTTLFWIVSLTSSAAAQGTCPEGQAKMSGGGCVSKCPNGYVICEGKCVDKRRDVEHCGACGVVCGRHEACSSGQCVVICPPVQLVCDNICVTPASNDNHCGGCDMKCPSGTFCSGGRCELPACDAPMTRCGRTCRDTSTDERNCGACGKACSWDQVCDGGQCRTACRELQRADEVDVKDVQKNLKKPQRKKNQRR